MSAGNETREHWSGPVGFVLAAVGSAVGLGNVWKFPYITGINGGGAFVLVYLGCIAVVGLPLLIAEMSIGRRSQKEPVGAFSSLAHAGRGGKLWGIFGWLAVVTAFLLLSFYSVVGGWTIGYFIKAVSGTFTPEAAASSGEIFDTFVSDPVQSTIYHAIFMAACIGVVLGGVSRGIERAARVLMPVFAVLLLVLLGYSLTLDGAGEALRFMFYPDFSKLTPAAVLEALGHSFFTLSLGMGVMIVYGSYLSKQDSVFKSGLAVSIADTLIALAAGVTIFGIVFSAGKEPGSGAGLVFITLPSLFAQLPAGSLWAAIFFLLLGFAALTSGMSILEVAVAYFVDERGKSRKVATLTFGGIIFALGLLSVLSFSVLSDVHLMTVGQGDELKDLTVFDTLDYLISNWALTLGGLGVALYAGWGVSRDDLWDELKDDALGKAGFAGWFLITRFVAPVAVILVLLHSVGVV
ncbi:sodium-dependent transporter [Persicimonas caeni]|uniref:Transporter n=1 Tax=Persicimonas caeni TaxID=2292766 RepID=A0A4Y6PZF1_PERCE|nr:sodium-dependent transporter [Persicimonas caeni]QDG53708.1 sodium-dependent transporter [Persicimonas caeni]QED34929.1 sodium-dependent transporter [Persicimonas caeni]